MHPYHHAAVVATRTWRPRPPIIRSLHNYFDFSKSRSRASSRTARSITTREGIQEAVRHFGPVIVNADGVAVSVETLALQHLAEDMSIIPSAADWLQHMDLPLTGGPIRLPAAHAIRPPNSPPPAPDISIPIRRPCSAYTIGF